MNSELYGKNLHLLVFQRNLFLALVFMLCIALITVSAFLFWKSERVVIVPAVVEKEFWVDGNHISATYLEQFGYFVGELLLSKSAQSALMRKNVLLRHTDAGFSGSLSKKLYEEEQQLIKQNAAYVFFPIDIQVNTAAKEVLLTGDRSFYVSGKLVSTEREAYKLSFFYSGSRLLLKGITAQVNK